MSRSLLCTNREVLKSEKYAVELASLLHRGDLPLLGVGIIINNILYFLFTPSPPVKNNALFSADCS